jgi:hypothetical protein
MIARALTNIRYNILRVKPNKKLQIPFKNWQIVCGDQVQLRAGNDRGKIGKVIKVNRKSNTVVVEGLNLRYTKYSKIIIYI